MKRLVFFIGFMTLATFGLIELISTDPTDEVSGVMLPTQQPANVMNMTEVLVTLHQGEGISWRLWAEGAQFDKDGQSSRLDEVHFAVYGEDANLMMTGSARSARLTGIPQQVELEREVVLNQGVALGIKTERLSYDASTETLVAPGPVRVTTPEGVHQGDSMRYAIAENNLYFTRPRFSR